MTEFVISTAHNNARLSATVAFADSGPGHSCVSFYDATDVLLAVVTLAKPCGAIAENHLALAQKDPAADLIATTGIADHAVWRSGDGTLVASGPVTDESGAGPFVLQGSSGLTLYAGGLVVLGATAIA